MISKLKEYSGAITMGVLIALCFLSPAWLTVLTVYLSFWSVLLVFLIAFFKTITYGLGKMSRWERKDVEKEEAMFNEALKKVRTFTIWDGLNLFFLGVLASQGWWVPFTLFLIVQGGYRIFLWNYKLPDAPVPRMFNDPNFFDD